MKSISKIGLILLLSFYLVGCANMSNQDAGTLTGGVAGGLLGSTVGQGSGRILAIAAGTLAGAYIGGAVGRNMDETDRLRMDRALERNEIGEPAYWDNPRTHSRYEFVPMQDVRREGYRHCREYRTVAYIGGKKEQIYGTACRHRDGSWQMVNDD